MSSTIGLSLRRELVVQRVDAPTVKAYAQGMLRLLLAQDGSTTRLCEAIADGPVSLHVLHQRVVHTAPDEVLRSLPGPDFIERITCLTAHGQVMMDNLSYIALDGLAGRPAPRPRGRHHTHWPPACAALGEACVSGRGGCAP
jgi:hypothetical protein